MEHHTATALLKDQYQPGFPYVDDGEFADRRANVTMCVMDIPGFGLVNLYSTHFYPGGFIQDQANELMKFVNETEVNPSRATIIAGDMNFSLSSTTQGIYDTFLSNGFVDSYREVNSDPGYTFGVAANPFAPNPLPSSPSRIDFIFVRGDNIEITSSQVVFDGINGEFVSDHFGVLTEITATPLPSSLLLLGSSLLGLAGLGYRRRQRRK
jgi:endonuclease/exonuclease/phosphatase family metal-dependent hydrolase